MGVSSAEVHAKAKDAAAALEAEGIPAPVIPEPPGGGDSPSVAKDGEAPPGESPPPTVPAEPQEPAPEVVHSSEAPRARPTPKPPVPALPKGEPKPPLKKELKLLEGRGLWALLAGAAIVILFVVFVLFGGGSGGGSDTTSTTSSASGEGSVAALEKASEGG